MPHRDDIVAADLNGPRYESIIRGEGRAGEGGQRDNFYQDASARRNVI